MLINKPIQDASLPITSGATAETVALYRWLKRLRFRKEWFIGSAERIYKMPADYATPRMEGNRDLFFDVCGKYPAGMQFEYHDSAWANRYGQAGTDLLTATIKDHYRRGCVISMHYHMGNPVTGALSRNGQSWPKADADYTAAGYWQDRTNSPLASIKTGGAQEAQFLAFLDRLATFLVALVDDNGNLIPVIWRPFHECTNSAHWWAGPDRQSDFILVWQKMVNYLRATKGVTNLLYCLNYDAAAPDALSSFDGWWPGPTYVDVITYDAYDNRDPASNYVSFEGDGNQNNSYVKTRNMSNTYDKAHLCAEFGYRYGSATQAQMYDVRTGDLIRNKYPSLAGAFSWSQPWGPTPTSDPAVKTSLIAMVNDKHCITADKLSGVYL